MVSWAHVFMTGPYLDEAQILERVNHVWAEIEPILNIGSLAGSVYEILFVELR